MSFLGLFRKEKEDLEFDLRARAVLFHVRQGATPSEAAQAAEVTPEELSAWKRSPKFRLELKKAKTDPAGLTERGICSLDDPAISGPPQHGYDRPWGETNWRIWERLHPKNDTGDLGRGGPHLGM